MALENVARVVLRAWGAPAAMGDRGVASRSTIASNTRQRFTFSDVGTGSENADGLGELVGAAV
jgi:hypothetical protein